MNILPLPLLNEYFCLDFMQQKFHKSLPKIFENHFLTNREMRNNPGRELRSDFEFAIPPLRINALNRFPAFSLPNKWNLFYLNPETNGVNINRDRSAFKKALKKYLLSKLKENFVCERLLCPSCIAKT